MPLPIRYKTNLGKKIGKFSIEVDNIAQYVSRFDAGTPQEDVKEWIEKIQKFESLIEQIQEGFREEIIEAAPKGRVAEKRRTS